MYFCPNCGNMEKFYGYLVDSRVLKLEIFTLIDEKGNTDQDFGKEEEVEQLDNSEGIYDIECAECESRAVQIDNIFKDLERMEMEMKNIGKTKEEIKEFKRKITEMAL